MKKAVVTFRVDRKALRAESRKALGLKMTTKLRQVVRKQLRDIDDHFKAGENGGWPLGLSHYRETVTYELLNFDITALLMAEIVGLGYEVTSGDHDFMITKKRKTSK